ncbi:MAG: translation initiation factor IF-2 subunit beta [Nanoarchaeota archaeon]|nr:translation initiation factor IF-2 subunit beta [Nanoarchaeota archaeon]
MDYLTLLKEAKEKLPEIQTAESRFEIPAVKGHIQGNKTVVSNFQQIVDKLGRPLEQLLKFLQRELATPAVMDGPRLVLGRKLSSEIINKKIMLYCKDFVICNECKKPDTKIIKDGRIMLLKCTACGAKHPIKSKI